MEHTQTPTLLTEDDLMRLSAAGRRYELVQGELVEMNPVGIEHSDICGNAYRALYAFVAQHKLGRVNMDGLIFLLHIDPVTEKRTARIPDASFVRKGRLPKDYDRSRPFPGAPDLAIEVVSPDEGADELMGKIRDYLRFGTEQVWVLYPESRELHQFIQGEKGSHIYSEGDRLSGGALLPGFEIRVADLFAQPDTE
ncbi:MAG: Uma2 family endonuclease [Anaerolineae bacterium]|nr:Uma2 family endonuclease [Anaerolineae bacterium]